MDRQGRGSTPSTKRFWPNQSAWPCSWSSKTLGPAKRPGPDTRKNIGLRRPALAAVNREIRRRTDVVGIFPNRAAVIRLVGAVLSEQHDEGAVARRHLGAESLAKARMTLIEADPLEEVMPALVAAS